MTDFLITEYNSKVRCLLLDIKTEYGFRLHCRDMEYDRTVAVWTDLLQVLVIRSSTPLAPQANQNANSNPIFNSYPHPNNTYLDRSSKPDTEAEGRNTQVRGGGQPME